MKYTLRYLNEKKQELWLCHCCNNFYNYYDPNQMTTTTYESKEEALKALKQRLKASAYIKAFKIEEH